MPKQTRLEKLHKDLEEAENLYNATCCNNTSNYTYITRLNRNVDDIKYMIKQEEKRLRKEATCKTK